MGGAAPQQIALAAAMRQQQRHYRIGPAQRGYDDPSYVHEVHAFDGNGLRPYRPVHLRAEPSGSGVALGWVRRTRIDGDGWELSEVPLGEEAEAYRLRVMQGDTLVRSVDVAAPAWSYDPAQDGLSGDYRIEVAQLSARYGPGPFASVTLSA